MLRSGAGIAVERTDNEEQRDELDGTAARGVAQTRGERIGSRLHGLQVLKELLAFDLVYWRWADGFDFSSTDESVYDLVSALN